MPEDFSIFFKGLPADFTSQFEEGTVGHRVEFYGVGLEFPSITAQSVVLIVLKVEDQNPTFRNQA